MGAGLSGIMAAIKLREAGYQDLVVYEKADRPGGTWRDNTYPGIACDIPSHFYSYSFAPNPDWSRRYASGDEIQRYILEVTRRFDVARLIRFSAEITRCAWEDGRWQVTTRGG
ncbi:MAG TPA: NAD(P)-binding protein, partial [Polyangiales bacterium]